MIVEEQRLGAALALVIAGARTDRVDVAPIFLRLRVDVRIAIDLARRSLEDLALQPLGEAEHVDRAVHAGLGRLHGIVLVVDRRCRTGEIVDLVDLDIERHRDVVPHEFEARLAMQVVEVALGPGEQVVDAQHLVPLFEQPVDQVRADEPRPAGHQNTLPAFVNSSQFFFLSVCYVLEPLAACSRIIKRIVWKYQAL